MLAAALEAEVAAYIEEHQQEQDERGHRLVVRNGKAQARTVLLGAGTVTVEAPRVNDRRLFELVEEHRGDAFRAVYTVRFEKAIYVLHCFQKKSPSGVRTAKQDVDLIHERLRTAQADYEVRYGKKED